MLQMPQPPLWAKRPLSAIVTSWVEDFAYMLEENQGPISLLATATAQACPERNFNDTAIPLGVACWTQLVENR